MASSDLPSLWSHPPVSSVLSVPSVVKEKESIHHGAHRGHGGSAGESPTRHGGGRSNQAPDRTDARSEPFALGERPTWLVDSRARRPAPVGQLLRSTRMNPHGIANSGLPSLWPHPPVSSVVKEGESIHHGEHRGHGGFARESPARHGGERSNQPAPPNPAMASRLDIGHQWRGVGEPGRWARTGPRWYIELCPWR